MALFIKSKFSFVNFIRKLLSQRTLCATLVFTSSTSNGRVFASLLLNCKAAMRQIKARINFKILPFKLKEMAAKNINISPLVLGSKVPKTSVASRLNQLKPNGCT